MEENSQDTRIFNIFKQYQDIVSPFIAELEVRDTEYPIEIFNEIRSTFTHLSRYWIQQFASSKYRKSNWINITSITVTIISIVIAIIAFF